jgi:RNA polymerase sigma-70 factor (ECF subfamily)
VGSPGGLSTSFFSHVPAASTLARTGEMEDDLRARLDAGRAAWPDVGLDASVFMRYLAERSLTGLPPCERAADLYFACGCVHGDAAALGAFDQTFRADIARAIARTDGSPAFLDEVMQILSVKLFVRTDDEPPAIAEYGGRASLRGWLASVAKRTALNLRRRKGDQPHDEVGSGVGVLGAAASPEIALLKARYKAEFEAAIRAALAAVPVRQRTLLLLHLVDGLTLPQLAAMQGVSRATVGRWLASAREALQDEVHRQLVGRLRASPSEIESLAELVRSQVEVSLAGLVAEGEEER